MNELDKKLIESAEEVARIKCLHEVLDKVEEKEKEGLIMNSIIIREIIRELSLI